MSYGEIINESGSGSLSTRVYSSLSPGITGGRQQINVQCEGYGSTAALKWYNVTASGSQQILSLAVAGANGGPLLNVSAGGAAGTGAFSTGNFSSIGIANSVTTQRLFSIGGFIAAENTGTTDSAAANSLEGASHNPATYGLLQYTAGVWQQSVATDSSAHRIWTTLGGGGSSGAIDLVQLSNGSGGFTSSVNLFFTPASQLLTVDGITATAGIYASNCFIQADQGFYTTSSSSTAINVPSGGVTALSLISIRNDGSPGLTVYGNSSAAVSLNIQNIVSGGRSWILGTAGTSGVAAVGDLFLYDATAGLTRLTMDSTGLLTVGNLTAQGITCQGVSAKTYTIGAAEYAWWNGSGYIYAANSTTSGSPSSVTISGGITTAITYVSDATMKTILSRPRYGLKDLVGLQVAEYVWNDQSRALYGNLGTERTIGFIAQDVKDRMPDACFLDQFGKIGFHKDAILGALVNAVNELKREIGKLKGQI